MTLDVTLCSDGPDAPAVCASPRGGAAACLGLGPLRQPWEWRFYRLVSNAPLIVPEPPVACPPLGRLQAGRDPAPHCGACLPVCRSYSPTKVLGMDNLKIVSAACGWRHTMAVLDTGALYTFGWNKYGQLGMGDDE